MALVRLKRNLSRALTADVRTAIEVANAPHLVVRLNTDTEHASYHSAAEAVAANVLALAGEDGENWPTWVYALFSVDEDLRRDDGNRAVYYERLHERVRAHRGEDPEHFEANIRRESANAVARLIPTPPGGEGGGEHAALGVNAGQFLSVPDLTAKHAIPHEHADAFRKMLDRWRATNTLGADWLEHDSPDRPQNAARYLYRENAVASEIRQFKAKRGL